MRSSIFLSTILTTVALASPVERPDRHVDVSVLNTVGRPIAQGSFTSDILVGNDTEIAVPSPVTDGDEDDSTGSVTLAKRAVTPVATLYSQAAVQRHNLHRANHNAGKLVWDRTLEAAAMKSAKRCTFAHFMNENGLNYGQNLALGSPAPNIASIITDQWYSEVKDYKNNYGQAQPDYGYNMENFHKWGHFTQVVWKGTSKIGCATYRCQSVKTSKTNSTPMSSAYGGDLTYCNYQAPGNYGGQYANNVGRPKNNDYIQPGYNVNRKEIARTYSKNFGQNWN